MSDLLLHAAIKQVGSYTVDRRTQMQVGKPQVGKVSLCCRVFAWRSPLGTSEGLVLGRGPSGVSLVLVINVLCCALGAFALRKFTELHEHLGPVCFTACMLFLKTVN